MILLSHARSYLYLTCLFLTQILLYPSAHIFADVLDLCSASTRTPAPNGLSETSRLVQIYTCDIVNQTSSRTQTCSVHWIHTQSKLNRAMFVDWIPSRQLRASCIRDGAFRSSVAYKTRNYVNFTTPRPTCRTQRSRCDLLVPQKREESSGWELEEAEIIPRESLRWYLCGM